MRAMLRQGLKRFIAPEPPRYAKGRREAVVIAVSSQKGGVGKTTTSVCLGAALARFYSQAVLILDMDAQGHVQKSLKTHLVGGGSRVGEVLLSTTRSDMLDAIVDTNLPSLHVTAADRSLTETESLMSTKIGKEFLLRDALKFTRTHYDVVLIDCPPNLGNLTLNALVAADVVLVPCDASPLAIQGVADIVGTMATINDRLNRSLDLLGIVLTRIDGRNSVLNAAVQDELEDIYEDLVFECRIGINTTLSKAQYAGESIFEFEPQSRAARHYKNLAAEVLERLT
jgi:chromosome partitioning protein